VSQYSEHTTRYQKVSIDQKNILGISVLLLLAITFTLNYLANTYYRDGILIYKSPGFWLYAVNSCLAVGILLLNKKAMHWSWSNIGLGKPKIWWKPVLVSIITFGALVFFVEFIKPFIDRLGAPPDFSFLMAISHNPGRLFFALIVVWVISGFVEEIVFRGFLINTLDILLGQSGWSLWASLVISSFIFGGLHAYQGITGVLNTTCIGFIFGVAYLLNGRRIWPLILVHGALETMTLVTVYNM